MDGSLKACMTVLNHDTGLRCLLELYLQADAIRNHVADAEDTWLDHPARYLELCQDDSPTQNASTIGAAVHALLCVIATARDREHAQRQLDGWKRSHGIDQPAQEETAAA